MSGEDGITLGELGRNVEALRVDLRDLGKDVTELKVTTSTGSDRTKRLEAIVYGALGTAVAGLITAALSLISRGTGS